jgi:hypothetical protein
MDVYQCPECELKFISSSELQQHLQLDHPDFKAEPKYRNEAPLSTAHRHRHHRPQRDR